ncbi:MAG: class I SAM-dependent methyltransferase [Betaproteobacteria bacterium]|nr:MAG: class I SAM-dependent methyltransferase [Betaproteobacteria bacterium]
MACTRSTSSTALPEVVARLQAGGRMLDFGCGSGRVAMAVKRAFPAAQVTGFDIDAQSIQRAREAASGQNLKIEFATAPPKGQFDLVTICDCIHDLAAPVETLRQVHRLVKPEGTLFIVEPKAADRLEDNRNPVATMFYGFSLFHCMTQSLACGGPGLGTCMGPGQTEKLVREAGFRGFRMLDIKSMTNLFYAATP